MDKLRMTCFKDHLRTTFYQSQSIVLLFIFHSDKYKNTLTTSFTKFVRCNSLTIEMVNDRNTDIKNGLVGFYSGCPREIFKYWTPNSNPLVRSNWENFFAGSRLRLSWVGGAQWCAAAGGKPWSQQQMAQQPLIARDWWGGSSRGWHEVLGKWPPATSGVQSGCRSLPRLWVEGERWL